MAILNTKYIILILQIYNPYDKANNEEFDICRFYVDSYYLGKNELYVKMYQKLYRKNRKILLKLMVNIMVSIGCMVN